MSFSRNRFGFTFQDVAKEFPEKNRVYLARILAEMLDKGHLKISKLSTYNADYL